MDQNLLAFIFFTGVALAVLTYGVVLTIAIRLLGKQREEYYQYLKDSPNHHVNLLELFSKDMLE